MMFRFRFSVPLGAGGCLFEGILPFGFFSWHGGAKRAVFPLPNRPLPLCNVGLHGCQSTLSQGTGHWLASRDPACQSPRSTEMRAVIRTESHLGCPRQALATREQTAQ